MSKNSWEDYAQHVIDELVPMLDSTVATVSLLPSGDTDVKFAVELGFSIMMDKTIILCVPNGARIPGHLARVADRIVEYGPDDHLCDLEVRVYQVLHEMFGEDE